jgi:O-methyltransferase involved in polyketide biosynthesis
MYLEPSTVIGVLRAIGELAGGSGVVFDYAVAPHLLGPIGRRVYEEFARRVEAIGEPWICAFDPADLRADLERAGFTTIDDLGEPELNERYFRDRADGLRVGSLAHVVRAFTR